jgi:DNA-directed RNA polymerase specialized sigma24 family protein
MMTAITATARRWKLGWELEVAGLGATQVRAVVRRLRESGLSLADTAAVLGVSKGRVSQLA